MNCADYLSFIFCCYLLEERIMQTPYNVMVPNIQHTQNRLLNAWQAQQANSNNAHMNRIFNSNNLMATNPNVQMNQQNLWNQMQSMQQIDKIQREHKKVTGNGTKINDFDILKNLILRPTKIIRKNEDLPTKLNFVKTNWDTEKRKYYKDRKNEPYKIIVKNEKYAEALKNLEDIVRSISDEEELKKSSKIKDALTIYKYTIKDKDKTVLEGKFSEEKGLRTDHDEENKVIYAQSKFTQHKKQFEKQNFYIYRIKHDTKGHAELKEDRISYYETKQKELEEGKKFMDEAISLLNKENLIDENTFNEKKEDDTNDTTDDIDKLLKSDIITVEPDKVERKEKPVSKKENSPPKREATQTNNSNKGRIFGRSVDSNKDTDMIRTADNDELIGRKPTDKRSIFTETTNPSNDDDGVVDI